MLQQMSVIYLRINFNGFRKFDQAHVIPECKSAVVRMHNDLLHWDKLFSPIISIVKYTVFSSNYRDITSVLAITTVSSCDHVVLGVKVTFFSICSNIIPTQDSAEKVVA
jgi:hypothetical protein